MILHKFNDIKSEVLDYWENDARRGLYCGFPFFNEYYSVKMGSCTDITGVPTSGKSQFLLEILINLSEFHGVKHALHVPDMGDPLEVISDLISMIAKRQFDKTYTKHGQVYDNTNRITEKEIYNAGNWLDEHFTLIEFDKRPSPPEIYSDFEKLIKEGITSFAIDSWKNLRHDINKRDDLYLDDVLTIRNNSVQKYGHHIFQIVHAKETKADSKGIKPAPGAYDIKGGSSWYDNGKAILTIHRPDPFSTKVEVYIIKSKPKGMGQKGITDKFELDMPSGRYFENNGIEKIYAYKGNIVQEELTF